MKGRVTTVVTTEIHPDEPCYGLAEMTLLDSAGKERRRYQMVYVSRGDVITPYVRDVTSVVGGDLSVPPLRIPSFGDDTVGQLWDLADHYRRNKDLETKLKERAESSTLLADTLEVSQQIKKIKANQTTFGSGATAPVKQRTGWNMKE